MEEKVNLSSLQTLEGAILRNDFSWDYSPWGKQRLEEQVKMNIRNGDIISRYDELYNDVSHAKTKYSRMNGFYIIL